MNGLAVGNLSDADTGRIVAEYLKDILSQRSKGNPLSPDAELILAMFKYDVRPCQADDIKCPYGSNPDLCSHNNGCYTTEVLLRFAESKSLLP